MLVFFDIDATLITTGGVGVKAMIDAGRDLYGPGFTADGVPFAGRLDPLILVDLLRLNGQEASRSKLDQFRAVYGKRLPGRLVPGVGRALPGVMDLLTSLERAEALTLGLLTGNFAETGTMKLTACGIDANRFTIRVWGDESPHDPPARDHLPGIGLERYRRLCGREVDPRHVVVIGDTPHDVACARAHGCRSIGVATGSFTIDALAASGADLAVPNLADTGAIRQWILS
jgi:phosphoglycolate phosphatase-like HAD superfamily hydrolase